MLRDLYEEAYELGLTPEELRRRQLKGEAESTANDVLKEEPEEPDMPLPRWNLTQLKAALKRRGAPITGQEASATSGLVEREGTQF